MGCRNKKSRINERINRMKLLKSKFFRTFWTVLLLGKSWRRFRRPRGRFIPSACEVVSPCDSQPCPERALYNLKHRNEAVSRNSREAHHCAFFGVSVVIPRLPCRWIKDYFVFLSRRFFIIVSKFSRPQSIRFWTSGSSVLPKSETEYSTLGGTSG